VSGHSFRIWRFFDGLLERFFSFFGGLLFGQFPHFYAQYLQRLGGHLEEARLQLTQYTQAANLHHLSLEEYIRIHLDSSNSIFNSSGKIIADLVKRFEMLEKAYLALREAPPLWRGWVFIHYRESDIILETLKDFTPGFPITWEGLSYAVIGIICFWGVYYLIKQLFKYAFKKSKTLPSSCGLKSY